MYCPFKFHFDIGFGGRRDLGLGSRAGQPYNLDSIVHIWVGFTSHFLKKFAGPMLPNLICYAYFFRLFCGEHDYQITLPQPQPPINALQCSAMQQFFLN